jgi:hypothetical protein
MIEAPMRNLQRKQLTAALGVFLASISLLAVVVTRARPTTEEQQLRAHHLLRQLRPAELLSVELEVGPERVRLERSSSTEFQVTHPLRVPVNPEALGRLLQVLQFGTFSRELDLEGLARDRLGLAPPARRLSLELAQGRVELLLGGDAPSSAGAGYLEVREAGRARLFVIDRSTREALSPAPSALLRAVLLLYGSDEVSRLELRSPSGATLFERDARGLWFTTLDGTRQLVRRGLIEGWFAVLADTDGAAVLGPEEGRPKGAGTAELTLRIEPKEVKSPPSELTFGGACPAGEGVVVSRAGLRACIPAALLQALRVSTESLLDPHLFWLRPDEVEALRLNEGNRSLVLERHEEGFLLKQPESMEIPLESGNAWLERLTALEGYPVPRSTELRPPIVNVELESSTLSDVPRFTEVLRVGAPNAAGKATVERASDGARFELSALEAALFTTTTTLLRPLLLWELERARIQRVFVLGPGFRQVVEQPAPGSYALVEPRAFPHDAQVLDHLFGALSRLNAVYWASFRSEPGHGLQGPSAFVISLELAPEPSLGKGPASQPELLELRIGRRTDRGFFASTSRYSGVFVLGERTVESLRTLALDRGVFSASRDSLAKVVMSSDEHRLVLAPRGGSWVALDKAGRELSGSVEELLVELEGLRAEAALHLGPPRAGEGFERPWLTIELYPKEPGASPRRLILGSGDSFRHQSVHYARSSEVDATYVILRSRVSALGSAF